MFKRWSRFAADKNIDKLINKLVESGGGPMDGGHTDAMFANSYHEDDDALAQLERVNPRLHKKLGTQLQQIQQTRMDMKRRLGEAQRQQTMAQNELRRIDSQYREVRFKISQAVADGEHNAPGSQAPTLGRMASHGAELPPAGGQQPSAMQPSGMQQTPTSFWPK
jgi:DNA gyrase/topoisomerase IV subunit A